MSIALILGKILFSYLFVTSGINHIKNIPVMAAYARDKDLPMADLAVLLSGLGIIVAPILFVFGVLETPALIFLGLFLITTSFVFHDYWNQKDQAAQMNELVAFNKNMSLLGAVLVFLALI